MLKLGDCVLCRNLRDLEYLKRYTEEKLGTDWDRFIVDDYNYPIVLYLYEDHKSVSWSNLDYFYERQIKNYGGGGFTNLVDINLILRKEKLRKLNEKF
jgi:hypothetical protein